MRRAVRSRSPLNERWASRTTHRSRGLMGRRRESVVLPRAASSTNLLRPARSARDEACLDGHSRTKAFLDCLSDDLRISSSADPEGVLQGPLPNMRGGD